MKRRYYIAYGSNLNVYQMRRRCPQSRVIGYGFLDGYRLAFKGSRSGAYLTIEPHRESVVPVGVYSVTEADEKALDRYEGFPRFYRKERVILPVHDEYGILMRDCFVYIMTEGREYGVPEPLYVSICGEGYDDFGFDRGILEEAVRRAHEEN